GPMAIRGCSDVDAHRIEFRNVIGAVKERPGMYGVDGQYSSAVAFVSGCDAMTGWKLLQGFAGWIRAEYGLPEGSIGWFGLAAELALPGLERSGRRYAELSPQEHVRASTQLFEMLDAFLAATSASAG